MFSNWRDCQEWQKQGLPLSTTNNEAAKMYDALLTQYVGWYFDQSVGGIEGCAEKLLSSDPNFVLGHALVNSLDVMGTGRSVFRDAEFKSSIDNMMTLSEAASVPRRERLHAEAVKSWAYGDIPSANSKWEDILVEHPTDILALKLAHDSYFYMGYSEQMRDSVARVMPQWNKEIPLYGYLKGMYSFGLVEMLDLSKGEKEASEGLQINKHDGWCTHSMAHCYELSGRQDQGIEFMKSTKDDWKVCDMLYLHLHWHWSLYHIEKGEYSVVLDFMDSEMIPNAKKSGALLDIVDVTSILYRLQLEGADVGDRWKEVYEICQPHIGDHILAFNDIHLLMSTLGDKQKEETDKLMESIKTFISEHSGTHRDNMQQTGIVICEAFKAYNDGDFAKAVDTFLPVKYDVQKIGGSVPQRSLFNLFLINAALKSPKKQHHLLARSLLVERKAMKEHSPMIDRLVAKATALCH